MCCQPARHGHRAEARVRYQRNMRSQFFARSGRQAAASGSSLGPPCLPPPPEDLDDLPVLGLIEGTVEPADRAEIRRRPQTNHLLRTRGDALDCVRRSDRDGDDHSSRPLTPNRPDRGLHRRAGGQAVVRKDHHPPFERDLEPRCAVEGDAPGPDVFVEE